MKTRLFLFLLIIINAGIMIPLFGQETFKDKRNNMVKRQIKIRGVKDIEVLNAMKTVERHLFVPNLYKVFVHKVSIDKIGQIVLEV